MGGWLIRVALKLPPSQIPTWGYMSCGDFITSCWALEGQARWPLVSENPRQKQRVADGVRASGYPSSRWMLSWDTCQDNPMLSFIARATQVTLCLGGTFIVICTVWRRASLSHTFSTNFAALEHACCGRVMHWERHSDFPSTERDVHMQTAPALSLILTQ